MERITNKKLDGQQLQKVDDSRKNGNPTPYQKKDGNWYCTYNGRQYYLGNTILRAQQKLEKIINGEGESITRGGFSLENLVSAYMKSLINNQSTDTVATKRKNYKKVIEFFGAASSIALIGVERIEEYKQEMLSKNKKVTVKNKMIMLSALFQYALKSKMIKSNPVREVAKIKCAEDPDPDQLSAEEIEKLFDLAKDQRYPWLAKRDGLVFMLMLHAGLRRIEVANLMWSDLNFDRDLIVLRTTKGGKPRLIGISATLKAALKDCIENWRKSDVYVVTRFNGKQLSRESLAHMAKKYLDRLSHFYKGKKRFSLHSLRSTFATQLAAKGASTRVIQGLLGHASPKTTMRYCAFTEKMAIDSVKLLDS
jgi:site-specific recombinase XerD